MSEPFFIDCPKDKWTIVAEGVTTGKLNKKSTEPSLYLFTYRVAGDRRPTTIDEGVKIFINSKLTEIISFYERVDIYVWPVGSDGVILSSSEVSATLHMIYEGDVVGDYTRNGIAYNGDGSEVPRDTPPIEYVSGEKRARFYAGTGVLPFPPGINTTVGPAATSLLAENINLACYSFDASQQDSIDMGHPALIDFSPRIDAFTREITFATEATLDTIFSNRADAGSRQEQLFLLANGAINIRLGGTDSATTATGFNDGGQYTVRYEAPAATTGLKVFINDVEQVMTGDSIGSYIGSANMYYGARTDGVSTNYDGCLVEAKHYSGVGDDKILLAHHRFTDFRKDTLLIDLTGNGVDGISRRTVDNLLQENGSVGYPVNRLAPTMGSYITDDGVTVQRTLKDFFLGQADGVLENSGNLVAINRYKVITTEPDHFGAGVVTGDIVTGLTTALDANNTVRQVSPASGIVQFTSYIPHGLTEDMPIIQFQELDFIPLCVEQTTGLIKGTDGTNTCVSASAVTPGSEISGIFDFDKTEMFIEIDGVGGTSSLFSGYFSAVGKRVLGITSGIYQSIYELLFKNKI